jgi:phage-related protein (TIGR01555 family)
MTISNQVKQISNKTIQDFKGDNYVNATKKLGAARDVTSIDCKILNEFELTRVYHADGLAKKIIDIKAEDMIREWITLQNDTDGEILGILDKLDAKQEFLRALQFNKIYGGSIIFMKIDDGLNDSEKPLNINSVKKIEKIKAFKRAKFTVLSYDEMGDPEIIQIHQKDGNIAKVHISRCLVFQGDLCLDETLFQLFSNEEYWGISEIQSMYNILGKMGLSVQSIFDMLIKANINVFKVADLQDKLEITDKDGKTTQLDKQVEAMRVSLSNASLYLISAEDDYEIVSQNFSGIDKQIDKIFTILSAVTSIPETILFGRSPQGLNATGNNEVRRYYDMIKNDQELVMLNPLNKLRDYIVAAKEYKIKDDDYKIDFNPLWQQTEEEIVKNRKTIAETDQIYINNAVVDPSEIRNARFGGQEYSSELIVEGELLEQEMDLTDDDQSDI